MKIINFSHCPWCSMAPRLNHHASCNAEALEAKGGTAHEVSSGRRRRELRARFSFKSPLARVVSVNESKKEASTCLEAARSPLFAVPRPNQRLINSCGALKSREKKGKGKRRKTGEKPKKRKALPLLANSTDPIALRATQGAQGHGPAPWSSNPLKILITITIIIVFWLLIVAMFGLASSSPGEQITYDGQTAQHSGKERKHVAEQIQKPESFHNQPDPRPSCKDNKERPQEKCCRCAQSRWIHEEGDCSSSADEEGHS